MPVCQVLRVVGFVDLAVSRNSDKGTVGISHDATQTLCYYGNCSSGPLNFDFRPDLPLPQTSRRFRDVLFNHASPRRQFDGH